MQIGYFLSSEEHSPGDLVHQARRPRRPASTRCGSPTTITHGTTSSEREMLVTPVGPDLDQHVESLRQYADAGVDELFVQQIGPEQDAFFDTWAREVLPRFA
jgi:hypothetical protein